MCLACVQAASAVDAQPVAVLTTGVKTAYSEFSTRNLVSANN